MLKYNFLDDSKLRLLQEKIATLVNDNKDFPSKVRLINYLVKEARKKNFNIGGFRTDLNNLRNSGDINYEISLLVSELAYNIQKDNDTAINYISY